MEKPTVIDMGEYRKRAPKRKPKYNPEAHVFSEDDAHEIAMEKFAELCDFVTNDGLMDKGTPRQHHIANIFLLTRYFIQFGLVNFLLEFGTECTNELLLEIQAELKEVAKQVKDGTLDEKD